MRTLLLVTFVLALSYAPARAQETEAPDGAPIESAEVSGLEFDRLSPGLRQDIAALRGTPLSRERLTRLASRIEEEQPDVVAAVRTIARPEGGARVVFLVARISDDTHLTDNINARYLVERVEISGVPESDVSQDLRDRAQALVGGRLDTEEADRLIDALKKELPGHEVHRRISRGSEPGRIHVIFEIAAIERPWIPFAPSRSRSGPHTGHDDVAGRHTTLAIRPELVYHADQRWSGGLELALGGRVTRVTTGFVFGNRDDLIEEYSGFRLRLENRALGTNRLGASLEFSRFTQSWEGSTLTALSADPSLPEAYRTRLTVEPLVTVAFAPFVRVFGGVSISDLESLSQPPQSQMANAWVAGAAANQAWAGASETRHRADATYTVRAGTGTLDSDLVYTRHLGQARYRFDRGRSSILVGFSVGSLTGQAPLFERFSLGDSSTLRGWNKYDIAPAGGDRMFHQSLEYRYHAAAIFVDAGSVWDRPLEQRTRVSTGFGLHTDYGFLTLGFPLNAGGKGATFMAGVRF